MEQERVLEIWHYHLANLQDSFTSRSGYFSFTLIFFCRFLAVISLFALFHIESYCAEYDQEIAYKLVQDEKDNSRKIGLLVDAATQNFSNNPQVTLSYIDLAVSLAKEESDNDALSKLYLLGGRACENIDSLLGAQFYYLNALAVDETREDEESSSSRRMDLGIIHYQIGNYKKAIDYFTSAGVIREKLGDNLGEGKARYNAADLFRLVGEFEKARRSFSRAKELFIKSNDQYWEGKADQGLAIVFIETGRFNQAQEILQNLIQRQYSTGDTTELLNSLINLGVAYYERDLCDSAVQTFSKVKLFDSYSNYDQIAGFIHNNLGEALSCLGDLDSAKLLFQVCIDTSSSVSPSIQVRAHKNLGKVYVKTGNHDFAFFQFDQAIEIAGRHGLDQDEFDILSKALSVAVSQGDKNRISEYHHQLEASLKQMQEREQNRKDEIYFLSQSALENEAEFFEAKSTFLLSAAKKSEQKWYLLAVSAFSILVTSFLLFFLYTNRQKLSAQQKQHALEAAHNQKIIDTIVKERKKISEDLHTDVGGLMTQVHYWTNKAREIWEGTEEGNMDEAITKVSRFARKIGKKVRVQSHELDNTTVITDGLLAAWRQQASEVFEVTISVNVGPSFPRLQLDLELRLYRITQEFVNNTIKHAEAENIEINASIQENKLLLTVRDDGKGIDIIDSDELNSSGIGLKNIKQAVEALKGTLTITNSGGTAFEMVIPLGQKNGISNYHS